MRGLRNALLPLALLGTGNMAMAQKCDVDGNGQIDRLDVEAIVRDIGKAVSGPSDPRDPNNDNKITVNDVRTCTLVCKFSNCRIALPTANAGPD